MASTLTKTIKGEDQDIEAKTKSRDGAVQIATGFVSSDFIWQAWLPDEQCILTERVVYHLKTFFYHDVGILWLWHVFV